ncbi:MAG: putative metal-dependent hydrolase, partial [Ferruginibacter sp.]|nr:putative metal-dependent hydrolase [Ferruginibacter sp.]
ILNLDESQLNTPYRPDGWNVKQLVHHVADSHMNAYIRFKLALTENNPTIKPYDEAAWANLIDTQQVPINVSLTLLHALHVRWVALIRGMSTEDWNRTVYHPEQKKEITLWDLLGMYSWHGRHHTAHITNLRQRNNW